MIDLVVTLIGGVVMAVGAWVIVPMVLDALLDLYDGLRVGIRLRRAAKARSAVAVDAPCPFCAPAVWPLYVPRQSCETLESTFDDEPCNVL